MYSGYSAQHYELLQVPLKSNSNSSSSITPVPNDDPDTCATKNPDKRKTISFAIPESSTSEDAVNVKVTESTTKSNVIKDGSRDALAADAHGSTNRLHAKSFGSIGLSPHHRRQFGELCKQETQSLVLSNKSQETAMKEDEFLSSLVTPLHSHTKNGKGIFEDLYLPPLPAPDSSNILAPLPSKTSLSQVSLSSNRDVLESVPEGEEKSPRNTGQAAKSSETIPSASDSSAKPPSSPGHSLTGSQSKKKLTSQESSARVKKGNSKTTEPSKEKLFQGTREKYCPTGTQLCMSSLFV